MEQGPRRQFAALLADAGADDALERGALLIAQRNRPGIGTAGYLHQLDRLASQYRSAEVGGEPAGPAGLGHYLHTQAGFGGNITDYYDPANSYLDRVIDRRIGIPVTLAVIYIAVGRRLGLALSAIGFPGHMLVGAGSDRLDPFTGGMVDRAGCVALAERLFGRPVAIQPSWLEPLAAPAIRFRMLGNLRHIFMSRRDFPAALECCDWQLLIAPRSAQELLDRGLIIEQTGNRTGARAALRHFLLLHPDHHAAPAVQARLDQLAAGHRRLH